MVGESGFQDVAVDFLHFVVFLGCFGVGSVEFQLGLHGDEGVLDGGEENTTFLESFVVFLCGTVVQVGFDEAFDFEVELDVGMLGRGRIEEEGRGRKEEEDGNGKREEGRREEEGEKRREKEGKRRGGIEEEERRGEKREERKGEEGRRRRKSLIR